MTNSTALRMPDWHAIDNHPATVPADDPFQPRIEGELTATGYHQHLEPAATSEGLLARNNSTFSPASRSAAPVLTCLAEWDGYVTEVGQSAFMAALRGVSGEGVAGERHEGEIALEELSKNDRLLLRPGAMFRLCILSEIDDDERPKRFAKVVFRRMPAYRMADLELADQRSAERHERLRVE